MGETILIPSRPKVPEPGTGTKAEGSRLPSLSGFEVNFTIGRDTPPVIYTASYDDYYIKAEMSGKIGLKNTTPGHSKYVRNLELAMSKNPMEAKQKMSRLCALSIMSSALYS